MPIICRTCNLCKHDFPGWIGVCEKISVDFICLMCNETNDVAHHGPDEVYAGETFECNKCHNYIKYYNDDMSLYKDEFYTDDLCIINDFQERKTYVSSSDNILLELPLTEVKDCNHFIKKIKSLIIFL